MSGWLPCVIGCHVTFLIIKKAFVDLLSLNMFFFSLLESLSDLSLDLLSDSSSGLLSNSSSDSFSSEERKFKSSLIIFLVLFYFFFILYLRSSKSI